MPEKKSDISLESEKPKKLFTLGHLGRGGLPEDLWNAAFSVLCVCGTDEYAKEHLRDALSRARTFEEYLRNQIKNYNKTVVEYDEDSSVAAEKRRIDPKLIDEFDKKMLKLREFAKRKKLNGSAIRKMINEEIYPMIYGKELKEIKF